MLAIRFQRQGRKNSAFFRVVLTESSRPPKSGFLKILGWYNPHTKEVKLEKEEITAWLDKGAKASNSVARLLVQSGIKHKGAEYTPNTPKSKKSKGDEKSAKPAAPKEEVAEEKTEEVETEESSEEVKSEEVEEAPQEVAEKTEEVSEEKAEVEA